MPTQATRTAKTTKQGTRHTTRYVNQQIRQLKDNDARPNSKRGMLLAALLPCRTMEEARQAFSQVRYKGPQISFASIMRWMVVNKYVALNDKEPTQQTTTIRLPMRLYEQARSVIESGETEARSLNDLLVDSLSDRLRKLRREHIDAEFARMKNDAQYQRESTELAEQFMASDWETLQSLEKEEA